MTSKINHPRRNTLVLAFCQHGGLWPFALGGPCPILKCLNYFFCGFKFLHINYTNRGRNALDLKTIRVSKYYLL